MILWTIQSKDFYNELMDKGVIFCNINKSSFASDDEEENRNSYKWLSDKMKEKVGISEHTNFPIWAWHTFDGKRKKPDLRRAGYAKSKTECVCIEIDVPDKYVVLSDFDSWHNVLNNTYASLTECEEDWDKEELWLDSMDIATKQSEIEKSWINIFKVDYFENKWTSRGLYIQATFWELKKEYIKKAIFFTAR